MNRCTYLANLAAPENKYSTLTAKKANNKHPSTSSTILVSGVGGDGWGFYGRDHRYRSAFNDGGY